MVARPVRRRAPKPPNFLAAVGKIDRVADGAGENQRRTQRYIGAREGHFPAEDAQYPAVADGEREICCRVTFLRNSNAPKAEHQRRIEIQNQPFEAGADIAQSQEIEKTRQDNSRKNPIQRRS